MNKPITVVREELKQEITALINESNLPAFVVADVIEGFLRELRMIEKRQYEDDLQKYNAQEEVSE